MHTSRRVLRRPGDEPLLLQWSWWSRVMATQASAPALLSWRMSAYRLWSSVSLLQAPYLMLAPHPAKVMPPCTSDYVHAPQASNLLCAIDKTSLTEHSKYQGSVLRAEKQGAAQNTTDRRTMWQAMHVLASMNLCLMAVHVHHILCQLTLFPGSADTWPAGASGKSTIRCMSLQDSSVLSARQAVTQVLQLNQASAENLASLFDQYLYLLTDDTDALLVKFAHQAEAPLVEQYEEHLHNCQTAVETIRYSCRQLHCA